MQASSFYVHIPMALLRHRHSGDGALVLRVGCCNLAPGDELYQHARAALDTKIHGRAFAVGVITGTILTLRRWAFCGPAEFTSTFGSVFGLGFAIEGFCSFFMEAIFIGIYVYGWDACRRAPPFLSGSERDRRGAHRLVDGDRPSTHG